MSEQPPSKPARRNWSGAAWVLYYAFFFYLIFVLETATFKGRQPMADRYVTQATQDRLNPWLVYVEEIDFYFIDRNLGGRETSACGYNRGLGPLRTPDIYVYTDRLQLYEWESITRRCLKHEVGHHIDLTNGHISASKRFQRLVKLSIRLLHAEPPMVRHWWSVARMIEDFPGINGNPYTETGWGGIEELYAELHEVNWLIQIPPPLQEYFDDYLYWTWWSANYDGG